MSVEIRPVNFQDLLYITERLREWDRREIFATLGSEQPIDLVRVTLMGEGMTWIAYKDSEPVAAFGASAMWPRVWSVWAFGTDRFREVALTLTRFIRRSMIPMLESSGAIRAECRSMDGHTEAHRWLESLGLRREATHPLYGKGGETFHTYVRFNTLTGTAQGPREIEQEAA
jgi:hypothetical protein